MTTTEKNVPVFRDDDSFFKWFRPPSLLSDKGSSRVCCWVWLKSKNPPKEFQAPVQTFLSRWSRWARCAVRADGADGADERVHIHWQGSEDPFESAFTWKLDLAADWTGFLQTMFPPQWLRTNKRNLGWFPRSLNPPVPGAQPIITYRRVDGQQDSLAHFMYNTPQTVVQFQSIFSALREPQTREMWRVYDQELGRHLIPVLAAVVKLYITDSSTPLLFETRAHPPTICVPFEIPQSGWENDIQRTAQSCHDQYVIVRKTMLAVYQEKENTWSYVETDDPIVCPLGPSHVLTCEGTNVYHQTCAVTGRKEKVIAVVLHERCKPTQIFASSDGQHIVFVVRCDGDADFYQIIQGTDKTCHTFVRGWGSDLVGFVPHTHLLVNHGKASNVGDNDRVFELQLYDTDPVKEKEEEKACVPGPSASFSAADETKSRPMNLLSTNRWKRASVALDVHRPERWFIHGTHVFLQKLSLEWHVIDLEKLTVTMQTNIFVGTQFSWRDKLVAVASTRSDIAVHEWVPT